MNILISTIFRDREKYVNTWYSQLNLITKDSKHSFGFSVYENDSKDKTKELLKKLDFTSFLEAKIVCEDLNTRYYDFKDQIQPRSNESLDRVKNLAEARNKTLEQVDDLSKYDYVLMLDPDYLYDPLEGKSLIEEAINYDILSGYSLLYGRFYDNWATRNSPNQERGSVPQGVGIIPVWSTYNGFCMYKVEPFLKGARFNHINSLRDNIHDCEMVIACQEFRNLGYNNIAINTDRYFYHQF